MARIESVVDEELKGLCLICQDGAGGWRFLARITVDVSSVCEEALDERGITRFDGVQKVGFGWPFLARHLL